MNKPTEYRIIVDIPPAAYRRLDRIELAVLRKTSEGWEVADLPEESPLGQKYIAKAKRHRLTDAMFQMIDKAERDQVHQWWESERKCP